MAMGLFAKLCNRTLFCNAVCLGSEVRRSKGSYDKRKVFMATRKTWMSGPYVLSRLRWVIKKGDGDSISFFNDYVHPLPAEADVLVHTKREKIAQLAKTTGLAEKKFKRSVTKGSDVQLSLFMRGGHFKSFNFIFSIFWKKSDPIWYEEKT